MDAKGRPVTTFINAFGEDITPAPGKVNRALQEYQNMARKARIFLLQNDKEPEVPEGGTPPVIEVSPKAITESSMAAAGRALTPETTGVFPQVMPKTPPGLFQPVVDAHKISVEPSAPPSMYAGEGMVTGKSSFDPGKAISDVRGTEIYKNWAEKTPAIDGFRAAIRGYQNAPEEKITTQRDIDLANLAMQIAAPGQTAGGVGMRAYQIQRIEESIPLLERLLDLPDVVLKRNKFPPDTRARIIAVTQQKIKALEDSGRSAVASLAGQLKSQDYDPEEYLFDPEKKLITGATSAAAASGGAAAPVQSKTIRLPSGRVTTGSWR
jgi:hypothetical protein